jgi:methyltransferase
MNTVAAIGAVIIGLLLAETRVSMAHEQVLRKAGAVRPDGDPYLALAILYPAAFVAMVGEGLWRASHAAGVETGPNWFVSGVILFAASKALKYWAIGSLGTRWTFRVFIVPGRPLVATGPYRYLEHPNYVGVAGELVGAAMMCGAPIAGIVGSVAFGAALWRRVQFESAVLRRVREGEQGS